MLVKKLFPRLISYPQNSPNLMCQMSALWGLSNMAFFVNQYKKCKGPIGKYHT